MSSEQNKAYFNNEAASYDSKHEKTLNQLMEELRSRLDFIGVDWAEEDHDDLETSARRPVRLLDYACGTGLVSRSLAPYTTQCVGVDLSENMVAAYNARAENQGLLKDEMHAYQGNLCDPSDPSPAAFTSPDFFNFDIAAVGLGFHHFDDPALAARRLAERLRTGGVLLILDFLPHDKMHTAHPATDTVTKHGFSEDEIKQLYETAGAAEGFALQSVGVVFSRINKTTGTEGGTETVTTLKRTVFIARGTKG
ncbi:S-adenosyl-L-methionine-dependent methyltransferase [Diplogelasinospora grovesii]|uniref:S-adenosyl-L-methionine-dependent methyltransferase n=1 Tax=Diplogelasinospora grovesii TaxID=303347 RepID=A0AAN6NF48_9PEZI|nr:S-adenosyl-L-methionine-dependent methyltransferase [Diplogelasinospora grovesii]